MKTCTNIRDIHIHIINTNTHRDGEKKGKREREVVPVGENERKYVNTAKS
jgi:hypothetical protein